MQKSNTSLDNGVIEPEKTMKCHIVRNAGKRNSDEEETRRRKKAQPIMQHSQAERKKCIPNVKLNANSRLSLTSQHSAL